MNTETSPEVKMLGRAFIAKTEVTCDYIAMLVVKLAKDGSEIKHALKYTADDVFNAAEMVEKIGKNKKD